MHSLRGHASTLIARRLLSLGLLSTLLVGAAVAQPRGNVGNWKLADRFTPVEVGA